MQPSKYWTGGHWEEGKRIIPEVEAMEVAELIGPQEHHFSILDLCCGDGAILEEVHNYFPKAQCYGYDLYIDIFEDTPRLREMGIKMEKKSLEEVIYEDMFVKWDYVVMRNTFGTRHIRHLNADLEKWIFRNAKNFIAQVPPEDAVRTGTFANYIVPHMNHSSPAFTQEPFRINVVKKGYFFYLIEVDNE